MKTAIYIEDGDVQLVITPENDFEKNALKSFGDEITASIFRGSFYDCRGGWVRQSSYHHASTAFGSEPTEDESLIIRVREPDNSNPEQKE